MTKINLDALLLQLKNDEQNIIDLLAATRAVIASIESLIKHPDPCEAHETDHPRNNSRK